MLTTNCTTRSTNLLINKFIHARIVNLSFSFCARYGVATGECDIENRGVQGPSMSLLDSWIYEARDLAQNRPLCRLMSLHSATHS